MANDLNTLMTIAIPFYSNTMLLEKALNSVLAQDSSNWLCIVCDDAGPDSESAEQVMKRIGDSRISFRRNSKNLGLAGNWNTCLDAAPTDLVAILHADDELGPAYCRSMLKMSEESPQCSLLFCGASIIDSQSQKIFSLVDVMKTLFRPGPMKIANLAGEFALRSLIAGNYIMCPTVCYRKSMIGAERFDPAWKMVLDLEFYLRLLVKGHSIGGTNERHYRYRRHSESQTVHLTKNLLRFEEEWTLLNHYGRVAAEKGWTRAEAAAKIKIGVTLNLVFNILKDCLSLDLRGAKAKTRFLLEKSTAS
jgi:glycosyltransferase involved in cell wall biosynthesis